MAGKQSKTAISRAWDAGLTNIPAFRLSAMMLLKAPKRLPSGVRPRMRWGVAFACILLASLWTIALPFVFTGVPAAMGIIPEPEPSRWAGLTFTAVGSFLVLVASGLGWAGASRHLDRADDFLKKTLRAEVALWIRRLYLLHSIGWIAAGLLLWALYAGVPDVRSFYPTTPGAWISIVQFAILSGTVAFFAATLPGVTTKVIYADPREVRTYRLDPSATPAVRLLVELISGGALLLLAVLLIQTASWIYLQRTTEPSPEVSAALAVGVVLVLLTIARTAVIPTIQLHSWIVRLKIQLLSDLDRALREGAAAPGSAAAASSATANRAAIVDEFFHVTSTENGPFRSSSMVQFGATVFGAAIAYAFVWIFGDPSSTK